MVESNWWQNRVAYQIYPKSFKDSNGDGVGDIRGIIENLDYLQSLGIGIIWISPIYQSPFVDQGYDISDYYAIDPIFGTMEDFDELIAQADKRDIKIVMDLVVNHCSDQHPWFQAALKDLSSHYADYFYFVESPDGPPNNWRSYFGGSVWEKLPGTNTYYLHSFHKTQPDLNWQNPRLRQEIYQMVNWWLDKGIAGFRIDAIINIKKNLTWQSYPADRPDGLVAVQRSLQDAQPIEPFLYELKVECFEPHQAFTVGEVFDASETEIHEFMGDQGYFSSIFDFSQTELGKSPLGWYDHQPVTAEMIKEAIFQTQAKTEATGYWSTIIENHDEPRGVNFYLQGQEINDSSKKLLATMLMMRRGLPFIYQGQEIGTENRQFESLAQVNDIASINAYHNVLANGLTDQEALEILNRYSRDNARIPLRWNKHKWGGFTTGQPWLQGAVKGNLTDVASQLEDKQSLWYWYQTLIQLRTSSIYGEVIVSGTFLPLFRDVKNLMVFERSNQTHCLWVVLNYQNQEQVLDLGRKWQSVLLNNLEELDSTENQVLKLAPYQALVLVMD